MMTSEMEDLKTNEFLRRRKLRLQQVREQSKDIAKQIRQRTKVEKLRQVVDLDADKQKEYFQQQEKLVQRLQQLYAKGIENVGASHRGVSGANKKDELVERVDLSKIRGKEAAAELKRQKQEKLDKQKKSLDRKLHARETANEISREKTLSIANKLTKPAGSKSIENKACNVSDDTSAKETDNHIYEVTNKKTDTATKSDMATQWDFEGIPNEWEPHIPALSLPKDDRECYKDLANNTEIKLDKGKRDLFALSEEMPSSLRGGLTNIPEERAATKPSLTIVSEYLQSRAMRLREPSTGSSKKINEDLNSLKQTIIRTRSSKTEGLLNVCHVLDEQLIPMPSWQAETCGFCSLGLSPEKPVAFNSRQFKTITSSQINKIFRSIRPVQGDAPPSPVLRETSPFRRNKVCPKFCSSKANYDKSAKSSTCGSGLNKKNLVTMYNHVTRDIRDIPCNDERLVVRDIQTEEDAYSQAMKESSIDNVNKDKVHQKKLQDMRNKVAMTKQSVEKEYKDTISFLNSLSKDKDSKPVKSAYMDEHRQQTLKDNRQQKLQQEYRKIEKQCRNHNCVSSKNTPSISKSPAKQNNEFDKRDFQYSWMPVPESDGNLAIHTIPTTLKESKSGNNVKFSKVDSYHEYRSRHKHTPPTKDIGLDKAYKRNVEATIVETSSESDLHTSSDTSSVGSLRIKTKRARNNNTKKDSAKKLSDAERIIIYKILDSKNDKIDKETREQLVNDIARSLRSIDKLQKKTDDHDDSEQNKKHNSKEISKDCTNKVSFEQLNEGVYKTVNDKGDNINAMYFEDNTPRDFGSMVQRNEESHPCDCNTKHNKHRDENVNDATHIGEASANRPIRIHSMEHKKSRYCGDTSKHEREPASVIPSAATSTTSLKVATNDKASNALPDGGYVKLIDEGGQEAGNFYIGATGFLRDDAYEVIIQLRKKETGNVEERKQGDKENVEETKNRSQHSAKCDDDVDMLTGTDTINIQKATKPVHEAIPTQTEKNDQKDLSIQNNQSQEVIINEINKNQTSGEPIKEFDTGQEPINVKNVTDQGVGTSFQDYTKSDYVMKSDPIPRPATSIYTQTTLSSPRPVLIHMTSSTSTAYMSPPEMVLPRYLKHNYPVPSDDTIYDPTEKMQEADIRGHKYCKYKNCRCKWCHAKKCKRNKCSNTKFETPPNTARSSTSDRKRDVKQNSHKHYNPSIGCVKHNSHHCESCFKECFKSRRSKHNAASKSSSRNYIMRMSSNEACTYKNNSTPHDKRSGSYLNPEIKTYVNKLLALNRESLKAIEVADQECSSVATPSSSIINVPYNIDDRKADIQNRISFEQIKYMLKGHILEDIAKEQNNIKKASRINNARKKKPVHKVKSLNISKHLLKNANTNESKGPVSNKPVHSSSSSSKKYNLLYISKTKSRSRSSPTPRCEPNMQAVRKNTLSDISANVLATQETNDKKYLVNDLIGNRKPSPDHREPLSLHRSTIASTSVESVSAGNSQKYREMSAEIPMNTSTQTNRNIDAELNFMQVAEDKLQNMEKIADLTEKCTKRLSNLAKVLEEVRKNKSLAYSQISTSDTSDSDQRSDKNVDTNINPDKFYEPIMNIQEKVKLTSPESILTTENNNDDLKYIPFLTDIPKPVEFKLPINRIQYNKNNEKPNGNSVNENSSSKSRTKPPPALSRVSLKHGQEHVVPHELSTVMEVESPMSIKLKNLSSRNNINDDEPDNGNGRENEVYNISGVHEVQLSPKSKVSHSDPDLLQNNLDVIKQQAKISSTESSDDSKLQMMDLKQFNDIMLKPFITLKEYAKQRDVVGADEGSNLEDIHRDGAVNDDISSLHSDGSLPDVIAELLKRNIISEPFKFDSASNFNSTTISSESTLSLLALSKVRKDKKKSNVIFQNKENVAETSDTMSISSNPDLENAFKKLGMGWASSTLKKTKERLALSSSSNTSSSSLSQFKLRSYNNSDVPALVTDSVSSVINLSMKREAARKANDTSRNAEQQTSLTNSMTVKEFLNNELAKKITFTNKSNRNDTKEEFVSLYETKMPEEMRHSSQIIREERSIDDSAPSGSNNRARTSTPVQIFKSTTYQSSSSSNMSNGLFSNADDLSSVKVTSNSNKNHSTSDKDDLTIPNFSLKMKKKSDCSMSE